MEIIHPSGQSYDLPSDASLEITRTNPFFNDIGEQSLPVTIPLTPKNKKIFGYMSRTDRRVRPDKELQVILRSGMYQQSCRQVIFGSSDKVLDACFYLNSGDFYAQLKEIDMTTIFADRIYYYNSTEDILVDMWQWYVGQDERFAVFPVVVNDLDVSGAYKILNRIDYGSEVAGYKPFYNAQERTESIAEGEEEKLINLPKGYYMTPFVRVNWILREIFGHFGYKLNPSFFSETEEFRNLVLLNNTADAIVGRKVVVTDLLPDMSVSQFLDLIRKRFRCEFLAHNDRTIDIVLFDEMINMEVCDLTTTLTGAPTITLADNYRLVIDQASVKDKEANSVNEVTKKFSVLKKELIDISYNEQIDTLESCLFSAFYDEAGGNIIRTGLSGFKLISSVYVNHSQIILDVKESTLEEQVLSLEDLLPDNIVVNNTSYPFIGNYRCVRSVVNISGSEDTESMIENELPPMFCFACGDADRFMIGGFESIPTWRYGSIYGRPDGVFDIYNPLDYTYSLNTYGTRGIYNIFHKQYDYYLRNAFDTVEYTHLMSEHQKMALSPVTPAYLNNQILLPDTLDYTIGKKSVSTGKWKSLTCKEPIDTPVVLEDLLTPYPYYWAVKSNLSELDSFYVGWKYKAGDPSVEYYAPPTAAEYTTGGQYHLRKYDCLGMPSLSEGFTSPCQLVVWLEPRMK